MEHCLARDHRYIYLAFGLEVIALLADIFDGFVARALRQSSKMGADLDSLSDAISFGVAPAVLGFTLGLRSLLDSLCLLFFVCCGVARLARFNATRLALSASSTSGSPSPYLLLLPLCRLVLGLPLTRLLPLLRWTLGKVKYFEGTPIPVSLVLVLLLCFAFLSGRVYNAFWLGATSIGGAVLHHFCFLYLLLGSFMISKRLKIKKP